MLDSLHTYLGKCMLPVIYGLMVVQGAAQLLKLIRNLLRCVIGLLTERCLLKGRFLKLGLIKSPEKFHFLRCYAVRLLLVTANVVPSFPILVTLMIKDIRSFETSVLTRTTLRNIPEDGILHNRRLENLKSYIVLTGSPL
jgi:hypothetical protein